MNGLEQLLPIRKFILEEIGVCWVLASMTTQFEGSPGIGTCRVQVFGELCWCVEEPARSDIWYFSRIWSYVFIYIVYAAVISIWICWIGLIVSISFQSATLNTIKNRPYGTPSMNRSVLHQGLLGGIQNIYRGKDSSDCLPETLAASDRQGPAPAPRGFVREGPGGGPRHSKRAMERAAFRPIDFLNMEKIAKKGYRGKSPGPVLGSLWDVNKMGRLRAKDLRCTTWPQMVNSGPGLRNPKATTLLGDLNIYGKSRLLIGKSW